MLSIHCLQSLENILAMNPDSFNPSNHSCMSYEYVSTRCLPVTLPPIGIKELSGGNDAKAREADYVPLDDYLREGSKG